MAKLYVEPLFKDKNRSGAPNTKRGLKPSKKVTSLDESKSAFNTPIKKSSSTAFANESPFSIEAFVKNLSESDRARLRPTLEKLNNSLEATDWSKALEITNLIEDLLDLSL